MPTARYFSFNGSIRESSDASERHTQHSCINASRSFRPPNERIRKSSSHHSNRPLQAMSGYRNAIMVEHWLAQQSISTQQCRRS